MWRDNYTSHRIRACTPCAYIRVVRTVLMQLIRYFEQPLRAQSGGRYSACSTSSAQRVDEESNTSDAYFGGSIVQRPSQSSSGRPPTDACTFRWDVTTRNTFSDAVLICIEIKREFNHRPRLAIRRPLATMVHW